MKKIIVIGGAGYVGSQLVSELLQLNFEVTIYDLFIYGDNIGNHPKLKKIKGDIRNIKKIKEAIDGNDYLIHLACISNDPSFDLDPNLGKEINYDCFGPLVNIAKNSGVLHFIYASSSSVYGLKSEKNTSEEAALEPLTDYSKYKAMCEDILLKYGDNNFIVTILRPATVCGFSKRQRFDLVVNLLTNYAYNTKEITVFGGSQLRPNIHIIDMCNAYVSILFSEKELIKNEIFNVGFENKTVLELANLVNSTFDNKIKIKIQSSDDLRSYHITSKKIQKKINFKTKKNISNAITDIKLAFQKNLFEKSITNEIYFNIKRMNSLKLK